MQIHLSFDYELFFGEASGSAQKCLLEPTQRLMEIAQKHQIPLVFFVDAGYLVQLKKHSHISSCQRTYNQVSEQLQKMVELGHEIGLHVHPHWEDSVMKDERWVIDTTRYKLADFSETDIEQIVSKYHQAIFDITGKPCMSYRAGGWCIQPFDAIKKALLKNSITIDSSIYPHGFHLSPAHAYDFRTAPNKDVWHFEDNPCIEKQDGVFKELAISPDLIPPLFYWNLYLKMRQNPTTYKPIGDGSWLVDRKRIYKHFYTSTHHFACADGFFASRLIPILKRLEQSNKTQMMVLSHPKSLASYSFQALDNFISHAKQKGHVFTTTTVK
jgi:peptidoglycan/xylan/chitin deacetylase (PgdA/CDA1 family)